jgi:CelD/BcsL family acetyltransferase involved in cellulose biosynthesis
MSARALAYEIEAVSLQCVDPRRSPVWRELLDTQPGTVFHSPPWLEVLARTYGWEPKAYVTVTAQGTPRGGVAFCRLEDVLGERVEVLPFSDYCDFLGNVEEDWRLIARELLDVGCPVSVRCLNNLMPMQDPRFTLGRRVKWHGLDLTPSLDDLWANISSAGRRAINKSREQGIEIVKEVDEDSMRVFFDMHLGIRKHKYGYLAQPYRLFQNTWEQFIATGNGFILTARSGAHTIGGSVFLRWKDTLYYKWNASRRGELQFRPNDGIIWEAIRLAKEAGCTALDFGLSDCDQEGLLRFKRKFGSVEKEIVTAVSQNDGPVEAAKVEFRKVLRDLTKILADPAVPDPLTARGGDVLYKYFA